MAAAMLTLVTLLCVFPLSLQQGVDRTLQRQASGADVVRAVVNRIQSVFGADSQFLRRIAFVESKDGTDSNTFRSGYHGGIWQVDEIAFRDTQDTASHPSLSAKYRKIMDAFGIDWRSVTWSDLRIPLYSGIAARLFLSNIPQPIPCDISGQAAYWKKHYNTAAGAGTTEKFIQDVETRLDRTEGCQISSDIMLVLDTSGSIGSENFDAVKQFVLQYVNTLIIGPNDNQVGVITFSSTAILQFGLNEYTDRSSLASAVRRLPYSGGGTNIPAALCELHTVFSNNATFRDASAFRIAIVMTDGRSGEDSNSCGFYSVRTAAAAVHAISPPVLVFGFGVGSQFNQQDVEAIATRPEFVSSASSFSFSSQLECVQSSQEDQICHTVSIPVSLEDENRGTLKQGGRVRWQVGVPESGKLFSIQVDKGRVAFYASTETTAPNEAFHQWAIRTASSASVFIVPKSDKEKRSVKRQINNTNETIFTVYTTVEGLDSNNTFTLTGAASGLKVSNFLPVIAIVYVLQNIF